MKRWIGVLAFALATVVTTMALGQEIEIRGPLAGAPSCRHCILYRSGRLSVAPTFGITLQDEFDRAMLFGVQLNYHVNDLIAIGVWGAFAGVHVQTALTSQIQNTLTMTGAASPNIPVGSAFGQQIGQINWMVSAPQLTVVPLRGKLALFQNIFLDTDFYLFVGLGIIGVSERAPFDAGFDSNGNPNQYTGTESDIIANQTSRASRVALTATFGAGINFYLAKFLSLSVEYRAFPFNWNTSGTDESSGATSCGPMSNQPCAGFPDYAVQADPTNPQTNGGGRFVINGGDQSFHFNQMINIAINIFLPLEPHVGD